MYTFNQNYFDKIDSEDKAYLLGFICTDGCLYKREGHQGQLSISIRDYDSDILSHFKNSLNSNHPIKTTQDNRRKTTVMNSIVFVSDHLFEVLSNYGLGAQKTYKLSYTKILQNVPAKYWPAFYLGLFDGDGNIDYPKNGTISKGHVRLSGPLKQLKELHEHLPFNEYYSVIEDKREYQEPFGSLEAKGTIGKYVLLKYMYSAKVDSLQRKKDNGLTLIERIENNVTNRAENIRAVRFWDEYGAEVLYG